MTLGDWWSALSRRGKRVVVLTTICGAALLLSGWRVGGYAQSLLLSVGVAVMLVVPLVLAGQALSTQLGEVRDKAEEVAGKVDELRQQVGAQRSMTELDDVAASIQEDLVAGDERAFADYHGSPSWSNLTSVLRRAAALDAVPSTGIRVDLITGSGDRLRVQRDAEAEEGGRLVLKLAVEDLGGLSIDSFDWTEGDGIEIPIAAITTALQRLARYPGVPIKATDVFERIGYLLRTAIEIRRRGSVPDLPALIEISPGGQWGLTTRGVQALDNGVYSYTMTYERLLEEGFFSHVAGKAWVDKTDFGDAYHTAAALMESKVDWFVTACLHQVDGHAG